MLKCMAFRSTLAAVACAISFSAHAMANGPTQVNVPAGDLVPALEALEKQAAIELVFQPEQLKSFRTKGVTGTYEPKDAVRILLKGTSLELRTDPTGAMVIVPPRTLVSRTNAQSLAAGNNGQPDDSRSGLQLAQSTQEQTTSNASVESQNQSASRNSDQLQEVIVTAQKRREELKDVPVAVTALSAESLINENATRLQDYFSEVPGLYVSTSSQSAYQVISIRGLSSGISGDPTVAITIDDVPFGASTYWGGGVAPPDLDPGDLAGIEVLRGPQGTLYGANSLGGLIKYVTLDPSTDRASGSVQAGVSSVYNAANLGDNFRASANIPLSDSIAIRASGFIVDVPGYIDNPVYGERGINKQSSGGGLLSALWQLSDSASLKLAALYQDRKLDGAGYLTSGLGDLQESDLPETGGYDAKSQLYSATLRLRLGTVDLTAITGYGINKTFSSLDLSSALGAFTAQVIGPSFTGAPFTYDLNNDKFTQEIRLSIPFGNRFDWLLGAFYTHEDASLVYNWFAQDPQTLAAPTPLVANGIVPTTYKEYAVFSDLTVHFSDRFELSPFRLTPT
jgi:iron complex outermembrane receptor protein